MSSSGYGERGALTHEIDANNIFTVSGEKSFGDFGALSKEHPGTINCRFFLKFRIEISADADHKI